MGWKLREWNDFFARQHLTKLPPMTEEEIQEAINYLREHNYPKPDDCPLGTEYQCPQERPACHLGICKIAVMMCGDF
jgi:hypothetical protein